MFGERLSTRWRNISIFKKLYAVVGVMALLIAVELFSMLQVMSILSAVRSFVGGEGSWSKAQKDAVQSLHQYVFTGDPKYYQLFFDHLSVNFGDRRARIELQKPDPDYQVVRSGFEQGKIHPQDINGVIRLFVRFHRVPYLAEAIRLWSEADGMLDDLVQAASDLDRQMKASKQGDVVRTLERIDQLNVRLTRLENSFSAVLGEGSRWLERLLKLVLIFAVLIVECTSLFFTFSFSRNLSRTIKEMGRVANRIGTGDLATQVPVHSQDELGQLAMTINRMTHDLKNSIGLQQKAETENQIKSLFLANMSHEIRTPLGVILGLTEALKQPDLPKEEQQRFVETIDRTGRDLRQIVNDILDLSKVEAGYLDIEKSRFSLKQFLDDLYSTLSEKTLKNGNALVFESADENGGPDEIYTDRGRLRQILTNIVGNGLKFTQKGMVRLTYWYANNVLYFRIVDTGIGMTQEQSDQLFHAFTQVDSSSTRKFGGTGLGLFLSQHLARLLGGNIVLESSKPDFGSSFLVTIASDLSLSPQSQAQLTVSPHPKIKQLEGKRILVVDDSTENQLLLQFFLKKWKVDVDTASDGKEGVDKVLNGNYDLVLMDIQMPIMDGYQATQELRKQGYQKPIIALTAHAMRIDRERCLMAGCNHYLTKPIEVKLLQEVLMNYMA